MAGACTDGPVAPVAVPAPEPLAVLVCRVHVEAGSLACSPAQRSTGPVAANRVVGGQDQYVKLSSYGGSYDSGTEIFEAQVTLQNLLADALGTSDGSTVNGIRVFFDDGPFASGGVVSVANATGTAFFTAADQPYFLYNQVLRPYEISDPQPWRFNVPSGVTSFYFWVYATGPQADETGPLLDAVWSGGTSADWSTASNWLDAVVPGASSVVAIPAESLNPGAIQPLLSADASVLHLRVGGGSSLGLGGFAVAVGGNVDAVGAIANGSVTMSGTGALLKGSVPTLFVTGSTALQGATATSGAVSVSGSLTVADSALSISIP